VLGSGCNMLVRDEGVGGVVLRLSEPAFTQIAVEGNRVRSGCGGAVSALISQAARHGLAGLETLIGIPGTVGGALRTNAGDRGNDIGQFVRSVEVMDSQGNVLVSDRDANYIVVQPGASARDVLRLMDLMRSRVKERFNVDLEREITVW
jgi:UDP-N-acetylmuramate dehydrogenase